MKKHKRKFVSLEDPTLPLGDVNADGNFSIADAVVLQKWILGIGELNNWQAGDVCTDGTIDVFDFCKMRENLTT